jgi:hypothetical protein
MKKIISAFTIIVVITTLFTGCQYSFSTDFDFGNSSQTGGKTIDASQLEELKVDVGVGNVRISKSADQNAEVKYKKKIRGDSQHVKEVADNIQVVIEAVGDKLVVEVKTNDGDSDDLWQWLSKKYNNINVSVDIDIEIPDNIEAIDVNVGVGDININGLQCKYSVVSGVGSVRMDNVSMVDKCEITTGTGDIDIDCEIEDADRLSVQSGVGSIVVHLPKDAQFDLDAAAGVGTIKGSLITPNKDAFVGDTLNQKVNGGGTHLEVTAGTGDITINK